MKFALPLLLAAAPTVTPLARIQTDGARVSQTVQTKEGVTVGIEQSTPDDRLVARDANGMKIADVAIYKTQGDDRVYVLGAHLNVKGELIAITEVSHQGFTGGSRLFADNLKTGSSRSLGSDANFAAQTTDQGKDLVAVTVDLGNGADDTRPSLLRVMDESNAQVLRDVYLPQGVSTEFVRDDQGKLKVLATGYNIFETIDIETGTQQELLTMRTKPTAVPVTQKLSIGEVISLTDHGVTTLYDKREMVSGREKALRRLPSAEVEFHDAVALIQNARTVRVIDIAANKQIGRALPRNPQKTAQGIGRRGEGQLIARLDNIAIVSQMVQPNSYMPGTILTYFDLNTGKQLRVRKLELYQLNPELVKDETGRILSVEHSWYTKEPTVIVDVVRDSVVAEVPEGRVVFQARGGRLASAHIDKQLCFAFVTSLQDETCVNDALISDRSSYDIQRGVRMGELVIGLYGTDDRSHGTQTLLVQ